MIVIGAQFDYDDSRDTRDLKGKGKWKMKRMFVYGGCNCQSDERGRITSGGMQVNKDLRRRNGRVKKRVEIWGSQVVGSGWEGQKRASGDGS